MNQKKDRNGHTLYYPGQDRENYPATVAVIRAAMSPATLAAIRAANKKIKGEDK